MLSLVLVMLSVFWFQRHLYQYTKSLLDDENGIIASLAIVVTAAYGIFKAYTKGLVQKFWDLLEQSSASVILALVTAIVIVIIVLFNTSSLYIARNGDDIKGDAELVIRGGRSFSRSVILSKKDPRFFCLRIFHPPEAFVIALKQPAGYRAESYLLGRHGTININIPENLRKKELHILRLVPGWGIIDMLPVKGGQTFYQLRVSVNGKAYNPVPLRRQPIYVGASKDDLDVIVKSVGQAPAEWFKSLESEIGGMEEGQRSALRLLSESTPVYLPTKDLKVGDQVEIDLIFQEDGLKEERVIKIYRVSNLESETIFLTRS